MRRLVRSPLWLAAAIGVALVAMLMLGQTLSTWGQERADLQSRQTAEVVVAAVVSRHLHAEALATGSFSPHDVTDLRSDLHRLRDEGLLLGLGVWRSDGAPLFRYGTADGLSAARLDQASTGAAWTTHLDAGHEESPVGVYLPQQVGSSTSSLDWAVVEVVLAHDAATQEIEQGLHRQQLAVVVLFTLLVGGLLGLRRRLLRRERQARHDPLTGLLNRRALYEDAPVALQRATRRRPMALLLLDLVEFKSVNDTLGHAAGDELLTQVAATLTDAVRPGAQVVRLGGDEFAVLLPDLPDDGTARLLADDVRRRLHGSRFLVSGIELTVDASIGIALAPRHGRDVAELLQHADVAMYQAKRGHGGSVLYDPHSDGHSVDQLAMVTELREALANDEFHLLYQPKVSLPGLGVESVEALLRWQNPIRGLLAPADFLPLLERSGLVPALTRWVLREAVRQAAAWRSAGMPLRVAVNLSPRSLVEPDLADRVLAALVDADLPPSFLELEITENAVMADPERTALALGQLHARGITVAIDDFGAGYTSLAHLRTLPVGSLKLDRSIVTHLLERPADEAVSHAVIDLAHRLGISVVAEGVETDAVLARLTQIGCDAAQGYAIARPLAPDALERWVAEEGWRTGPLDPFEVALPSDTSLERA